MSRGWPPALSSQRDLLSALTLVPSRSQVNLWLQHWKESKCESERLHFQSLEAALLRCCCIHDRCGFRAAWMLALLADEGLLHTQNAHHKLMKALDAAPSPSIERELRRAVLRLPWELKSGSLLMQWAVNVVFVKDVPAAFVHQSLQAVDRFLRCVAPDERGINKVMLQEALQHLMVHSDKPHVKKKAALLRARLSS